MREGGIAVVTSGFVRATLERGIKDMTSVRPTERKVRGTRYQLTNLNISTNNIHVSDEPAEFTVLNHKNNATWYDVLLHVNDFSTAVMTEDYYGRGFLYILNIPDNFGDLYRLPKEVIGAIAKNFARKGKLFLSVSPKYNLFCTITTCSACITSMRLRLPPRSSFLATSTLVLKISKPAADIRSLSASIRNPAAAVTAPRSVRNPRKRSTSFRFIPAAIGSSVCSKSKKVHTKTCPRLVDAGFVLCLHRFADGGFLVLHGVRRAEKPFYTAFTIGSAHLRHQYMSPPKRRF